MHDKRLLFLTDEKLQNINTAKILFSYQSHAPLLKLCKTPVIVLGTIFIVIGSNQ